jgi:hypothetical protein
MKTEEALARAAGVLGGVPGRAIQELCEWEAPEPIEAAIVVSDEVPFAQALALYSEAKAQRDRTGLAPIVVTADGWDELLVHQWLYPDGRRALERTLAAYEATTADAFFARRATEPGAENLAAAFDETLDDLRRMASGRDPMSILHRLRLGDLDGAEEEMDVSADLLLPDDVRAAHAQQMTERAADREWARRSGRTGWSLVLPVRTFDEATALAEMKGGPSRLALVSSTPARALLHLGWGGSNACPPPHEQARVWEHWAAAWGAEPVLLSGNNMLAAISARPVDTREGLVRFARELALYDIDLVAHGCLAHLGRICRNVSLDFWWD